MSLKFKVVNYRDVPNKKFWETGAKRVRVRWLISEEDGAKNFALRLFEVEPNGQTALHSHDHEHGVFVLGGKGLVVCDGSEKEVEQGHAIYIPPNSKHCFKNSERENFYFLCLVPGGE